MNKTPKKQRMVAVAAAGAIAVGLAGCAAPTDAGAEGPTVVVTSSIFGDIASELVGDQATVKVLIPAGSDPHEYQPSTKDISQLHSADLVFAVGLGFEEALAPQLESAASDGVNVIDLGDSVKPLKSVDLYGDVVEQGDHGDEADEHEGHDHSDEHEGHDHGDEHEGHDHGPIDPHFWHDPQRVSLAVDEMAHELGDLDGIDAKKVEQNAAAYQEKLEELDTRLEAEFAKIPDDHRKLITQHRVLGYLAHRYGFETVGEMIPSTSTLAQASAAQINDIVKTIEATGVPAVFTDVTQSDALAETIQSELGGKVEIVSLFTESLASKGEEPSTYIDLMRMNGERIAEALQ